MCSSEKEARGEQVSHRVASPILTHILYVHDSKFDRDLVRHVLEVEHGHFRITEAATKQEFEARLAEGSYDLILTDFNILGYEGFEVLETVRAHDARLPVVIVTGTGSEEVAVEAMRRGVTDYVIKTPRHLQRLPHTILASIERNRLRQQSRTAEGLLRARVRQQAVVVELGQRALAGMALPVLMQETASLVAETLEVEYCHILRTLADGVSLCLEAGVGWEEGPLAKVVLQPRNGARAFFPRTIEAPVIIHDLPAELGDDAPPLYVRHGIVSGMSVSIPGEERPFGVLGAHTRRRESFSPEDLHFLQAVANVLATAIERKQAEQRLRKSEERFRTLIETARDVIYTISADGIITSLNQAFETLTGFLVGTWIGQPFQALVYPEDRPFAQQIHERLMRGERPPLYSLRILTREGGFLVGEFTSQPSVEDGVVTGAFGIGRDVSDRKEFEAELIAAKEQAEEMSRLKSAFLTNMSHEIRTPLTSIIGFASILANEVCDEHRELIQLIEQSGQRLLTTLNSVLDLAMLEAGSMQINWTPVNLIDEVREKVLYHQPMATPKGLSLHFEEHQAEVIAELDRAFLDRILNHLIGNAVKFTREGTVSVHVDAVDGQAEIHVRDTGVGIQASFLPHLFEAFKQENMGIDRPFEGTGLGLAITKKMVALMGGDIRVISEKGTGSTFILSFPLLEQAPPAAEPPPETVAAPAAAAAVRILAVEDNPDMLVLVERFLGPLYEVATASDEEEALERARQRRYDVVLMDINLGRARTGVEVLEDLRKIPGYETVPVVAVTAYALPGDREHFLETGFNGYLSKPFTKQILQEVIEQVTRLS